MSTALRTKRLTLNPPNPADLDAYNSFYAVTDTKVGKYRGGRSASQIHKILHADISHWEKGFGIWILRLAEGEVVGGAGLVHPNDWPSHELTWWLMPKYRGLGYATEASRAVIAHGYNVLGWPQVETHMRDDNLPARRLAERLGGKKVRRDVFPDGVARNVFVLPRQEVLA